MSEENEEEDFHHDYFFLKERREIRERDRKQREAEEKKAIEESVAKKSELLAEIGERLVDIAVSEEWWKKIRSFIEQGVGNEDCQLIVIALKRSEGNIWALHAMLSPFKYKKGVDFKIVEPQKE